MEEELALLGIDRFDSCGCRVVIESPDRPYG